MKDRIYIKDLKEHIGKKVMIAGFVDVRRDQGKMIFFDLRDMTGKAQCVVLPSNAEVIEKAKEIRLEWVLKMTGIVNKRPEKNIKAGVLNGELELEVLDLEVLSEAAPLPFDMSENGYNLDLTTELDNRSLVLRQPRVQAIFKIQETVIEAFREFMKKNNFFEFQAPAITPATAEGGAEVFQVDYFGKKAYLSQSPQLYKQIVMSAFERCFSVNKVFRAEPSSTTRHLTEIVCLDAEMGFIDAVLVSTGIEKDLISHELLVAGDDIGARELDRVADMRIAVHVRQGCRYIERLFGSCFLILGHGNKCTGRRRFLPLS